MYYIPEPPYFLMIAGLLASIASGVAFEAVLKQSVREWSQNRSTRSLSKMQGIELFLPFVGMVLGVCFFLASGVELFGFPTKLSYAVSVPLTLFIAWLIWKQLGVILVQLERGGSKAIDLDAID